MIDYIIGISVVAILLFIIIKGIMKAKRGETSGCSSCSSCPSSQACSKNK